MPRRDSGDRAVLRIKRLNVKGRTLRDLLHIRGGPVVIDEVNADGDFGGDVVNVSVAPKRAPPRRRRAKPPKRMSRAVRGLLQCAAGALGVGGMVAASGIAHALGWS